ncbi:MAG: hypothetical protein ACXW20_15820 [Burkholderiales bacterium]
MTVRVVLHDISTNAQLATPPAIHGNAARRGLSFRMKVKARTPRV